MLKNIGSIILIRNFPLHGKITSNNNHGSNNMVKFIFILCFKYFFDYVNRAINGCLLIKYIFISKNYFFYHSISLMKIQQYRKYLKIGNSIIRLFCHLTLFLKINTISTHWKTIIRNFFVADATVWLSNILCIVP